MTPEAYATMLRHLLPPGKIWRVDPDGSITAVLLGTGDEMARIDARGQALSWEADPRTTTELLPDFERVLGITAEGTLAERRARVVARLVARQRVRPVDYQTALAPLLGQTSGDVVVLERDRAFAILVEDDSEIYRFFIYRDPTEPGSYDLESAQSLVDAMSHSHVKGHVIESIDFLCDDEFSLCDRDLLGA